MYSVLNFKIVAVGESATGKTSLIYKYIKGQFRLDYNVTLGVQFYTKTQKVGQDTIQLQIWDTAGQEAYRSIVKTFYKGSAAVLLVFALNDQRSFKQLKYWFEEIKENVHPQTLIFLIGTKSDLDKKQIPSQRIQQFIRESGSVIYYQTSSKTGAIQLFVSMGQLLMSKYKQNRSFKELVNPNDERFREYENANNEFPQNRRSNNPVKGGTKIYRVNQPYYSDSYCC